jgi:ribose transport system substrate-binding protein
VREDGDVQVRGVDLPVGPALDATPPLLEALQKGEINALVAQDPNKMGYLAVQTVLKKLNGETVEPIIDTGVRLITQDSLKDPEVKKFLNLE